jgi:hypothetical protein
MARPIIAIVVGYITMLVLVSLMIMCGFLLMGTEWSFKPGSFEASNKWIAMSVVGNLVIAIAGGFVCALIARGGKAPLVLAVVAFVLGLVFAIPAVFANRAGTNLVRTGTVTLTDAMQKAREPLWVPFSASIIGAVGVLIGGKLKKRT